MSGILFDSVEKVSSFEFKYRWSGTGPYTKYLDGEIDFGVEAISPGVQTDLIVRSDDAEEPTALEVIDTSGTDVAEQATHPPFATLQWRGLDCHLYRIEQLVSSTWTTVEKILEQRTAATGFGYRIWKSQPLTDGTAYQFRVIPEDLAENEGTPVAFSFTHMANPDPPSITMTYSAGTGDLTTATR